jgi:hypothetical protein
MRCAAPVKRDLVKQAALLDALRPVDQVFDFDGGQGRNRTTDTRIFSPDPEDD